jgi:hypothetical protein
VNPGGPVEEAGLTARSMTDALKSTPVILAILIFNLAFMVMIGWSSHETGDRWERTVQNAIKYCVPVGATP